MTEFGNHIIHIFQNDYRHLIGRIIVKEVGLGPSSQIRFTHENMDMIWLDARVIEVINKEAECYNLKLKNIKVWNYENLEIPKVELELEYSR